MKNTDANTNKTIIKDRKAAAESNTEIKERERQTVTVTMTEVVTTTTTEANAEMKRAVNFEFKKNIRLLTAIQMMLRVLFIFQMSLLCFYAD